MPEVAWEERERMRERPAAKVAYKQKWRDLLFMHFAMDPAELRPLIPEGLDLDLYPDSSGRPSAWIGVVPFRMEGIRFSWSSSLPWLSAFPETNVRTYVHRAGKEPGVWFFSLDAARWIACKIGRSQFGLAYWHAHMRVKRHGETVVYDSTRIEGGGNQSATLETVATIGPAAGCVEGHSLDFFLLERYLLYALRAGVLCKARVWHRPYPVRGARLDSCHQSLTAACGLPSFPWEHVIFSDGVNVDIYRLEGLDT
ncbi:MAG TPA: DUF2071 domain-containing protein [Fimbriimonadaceae bacterium]|nr:DUF2071 domain-containing protein [Fimbriimonadaceae bacterium]HRJ95275.1 DUF2071 domain-containing protein [Fimbriimonadaceae bacterium]